MSPADLKLPPLRAQTSLNSQIDQSQVHCLNEASDHTLKDTLRGGGDKWLESDADEQLLLQIPVRRPLAVSLLFVRGEPDRDLSS